MTRLEPLRLFEHTFWGHLNPDARVRYELEPTSEGCRQVLIHRLSIDDLARAAEAYGWDDPLVQVPRTAAGWHRILDALEASVNDTTSSMKTHGPELVERYAAQLH